MKLITTIITTNVFMLISVYSQAFITSWKTDNIGSSEINQITIPTFGSGYDYSVDWGDGVIDDHVQGPITHTYQQPGIYTVSISGNFPRIYFNNEGDAEKLISIEAWGDIRWSSMENAFYGCSNLVITATDAPDLSQASSLRAMFSGASSFNQPINHWTVNPITDMAYMFKDATSFNQCLNKWNVSHVTNMAGMFSGANTFNQDLKDWNVSNVIYMSEMFSGAASFNQNIQNWNVSSVIYMYRMFQGASSFNQALGDWKVGNVTDMARMFRDAVSFNQDLNSWDISNATQVYRMFENATAFNQPLSNWDISNITNLSFMFKGAGSFDQNINNWDVSHVINMYHLFENTSSFNQPLDKWNVSNVTNMSGMFKGALSFNQDLNNWNVENAIHMGEMFADAISYNQPLNSWKVNNVTTMTRMFHGASSFNQDLGTWNIGQVRSMKDMLSHTAIPEPTYDAILIGWANQNVQKNVPLGASATYCQGTAAKNQLLEQGWSISDLGKSCSSETNILKFELEGQTKPALIDTENRTIIIEVSHKTNAGLLVPFIQVSEGATIGPSDQREIDFTQPVVFTVSAEDGFTVNDWKVIVTIAPNIATDIISLTIPEQTQPAIINTTSHTVNIEVLPGTVINEVYPNITVSEGASVSNIGETTNKDPNTHSYTCTVIAEDGVTKQSWTVIITLAKKFDETLVNVYPNPSSDFMSINSPEHIEIRIMDLNGRTVISKQSGTSFQLDLRLMERGMYLLIIRNATKVYHKKIQKLN